MVQFDLDRQMNGNFVILFFFLCKAIPIKCLVPIAPPLVMVGQSVGKKKNEHLKGSGLQRKPGC